MGLAYGAVLETSVGFYDHIFRQRPSLNEITRHAFAFKLWVMKSAISSKRWRVIGQASLSNDQLVEPDFYMFDIIAKRFFIYGNPNPIPATREQCLNLECAAAWSAEHVESRLIDHFAGRANAWALSLSAARRA